MDSACGPGQFSQSSPKDKKASHANLVSGVTCTFVDIDRFAYTLLKLSTQLLGYQVLSGFTISHEIKRSMYVAAHYYAKPNNSTHSETKNGC